MTVTKCDICKKTIENSELHFTLSYATHFLGGANICESCGEPLKLYMIKNKLKLGRS
jgi:hypothetical protein